MLGASRWGGVSMLSSVVTRYCFDCQTAGRLSNVLSAAVNPTAAVATFTTAGMTFPLFKPGDAVRPARVGSHGVAEFLWGGGGGDE